MQPSRWSSASLGVDQHRARVPSWAVVDATRSVPARHRAGRRPATPPAVSSGAAASASASAVRIRSSVTASPTAPSSDTLGPVEQALPHVSRRPPSMRGRRRPGRRTCTSSASVGASACDHRANRVDPVCVAPLHQRRQTIASPGSGTVTTAPTPPGRRGRARRGPRAGAPTSRWLRARPGRPTVDVDQQDPSRVARCPARRPISGPGGGGGPSGTPALGDEPDRKGAPGHDLQPRAEQLDDRSWTFLAEARSVVAGAKVVAGSISGKS